MWTRRLAWREPEAAAVRMAALPGLAWLDSAMPHGRLGRWSYLCAEPFGRFVVDASGVARWNGEAVPGAPLDVLRGLLARFAAARRPELPPFQGGALGSWSYEFGWTLEGRQPPVQSRAEMVNLGFYDCVLAFDHAAECCLVMASGHADGAPDGHQDEAFAAREARALRRIDRLQALLETGAPREIEPAAVTWRPVGTRADHRAAVGRVRQLILAGDIYQANVARRFVADMPRDATPFALYRRLRAANPAPYGAYLDHGARQILCSSPELFLESDGRRVETRPIKGTVRRLDDPVADRTAAARLEDSAKNRAENVMIVDLLRNDLARVCEPASVAVPALCAVESYAGLHHLVSAVTGTLRADADALDLLAASFPGGSITGAPKLQAMEIIAAIERRARDEYCGAIGWIGFDGAMALNIAIRTILCAAGRLDLSVGGGITLMSDAAEEFEETLVKADRMLAAFAPRHVAESA